MHLEKLKKYAGPYISELDYTHSFISGSAMAYLFSRDQVVYPTINTVPLDWKEYRKTMEDIYKVDGRFATTEIYGYGDGFRVKLCVTTESIDKKVEKKRNVDNGKPKIPIMKGEKRPVKKTIKSKKTVPNPFANQLQLDEDAPPEIKVEITETKTPVVSDKKDGSIELHFDIVDAADLDLGVDVETMEEFDTIAKQHYQIILKYYGFAKIRKIDRLVKDMYYYQIYTDDPKRINTFRKVDIFKCRRVEIITWHVPAVRAMYTIYNGVKGFHFSASCLYSMKRHDMDFFNHFMSKRTTAEEIILKFKQQLPILWAGLFLHISLAFLRA